jgi:hypothetical protein
MSDFDFPYGYELSLILGDLRLDLNWYNFHGNNGDGLGAKRTRDFSQQATISESRNGSTIIEGDYFKPKHIFEYEFFLNTEEKELLEAIWEEQQDRSREQNPDLAVRLLDQRMIFKGKNSRKRAKIGDIVTNPIAPIGFQFFWCQFDIFLKFENPSEWFGKVDKNHFITKIKAREMDLVPPSEDLP